jgi:hypothetical protein
MVKNQGQVSCSSFHRVLTESVSPSRAKDCQPLTATTVKARMALVSSAKTEPQQHVIEPSPALPMTLTFSFRASHSELELGGSTCTLSFAFRGDAVRDLRSTGRQPTGTLTARPTLPHDQLPCVRTKNLQMNLWTIQRLPALWTFPSRKPATVWCQRRKPWFSSQSASANSTISC